MGTHVRCGNFFSGRKSAAEQDYTVAYGDNGIITYVGPTADAPPVAIHDVVLNYGNLFIMPGLVDVHTHLAYGNAKTEEDIDLYQPMEFRSLRGLFFAQKVVAAAASVSGAVSRYDISPSFPLTGPRPGPARTTRNRGY